MKIELNSIGTIHSPHKELEGMPIQPTGAKGVHGEIEIKDQYAAGLKDIDGFSHLILIYYLHECRNEALEVKLEGVDDNVLHISNVDILDGTPLLDIKPYVPQLFEDTIDELRIGWFEKNHHKAKKQKADDRFID